MAAHVRSCRSLPDLVLVAGWPLRLGNHGRRDGSIPSSCTFDSHDGGRHRGLVTVNGNGPFRFLLDTGSSRTGCLGVLANALMLVPLADTALITPTGRAGRPIAVLRRLEVGAAPPTNVLAMIVPMPTSAGQRVDGIVGQDVLAALTYTIDYVNRHIVWHVTPPPNLMAID